MPQQMAPAQPLPMQPMPAHAVPPAQPVAPQPVIPQQTGVFQPAVPQQTAPAQPIATHPVTPPYPEAARQSVSAHAMPAHQPAVQDPAVVPAQPGQMGGQAVQAPASPTHAAQAPFETLATQPAADQSEEDRIAPRRRALKAGTVSYNGGNMTFPCVLRDISETGARIRTDGDWHPPDTFKLLIELDGFVDDCEVVWRDGSQVGIRFIGQPQICAPKRSQVVYPSEVRQNIMVRRKPVGSLG